MLHGWFSEKQYKNTGVKYVYLNKEGTKIQVTTVTKTKKTLFHYDDVIYKGQLVKIVIS